MSRHFCKTPCCGNLAQQGYQWCEECYNKRKEYNKTHNTHNDKMYDKYSRNKDSKAIYTSKSWMQKRKDIMDKHNGLCNRCGAKATMIHHIKPLTDDGDAYNNDNLVPLCWKCHGIMHKQLNDNK